MEADILSGNGLIGNTNWRNRVESGHILVVDDEQSVCYVLSRLY